MDAHGDTVRVLAGLPSFAGVNANTIRKVASRCRPMTRRAGENLFMEGDPCRGLYILAAGRLKCYRASAEGREQILKVLERPGEIFCTTAAFSTGSHIVTADAMTDTALHVIDVETMRRVALEEPTVTLALISSAGDQMRGLVGLADDLSLKTATTRVAKLLCQRAREEGQRGGKDIRLPRDSLREDEIAAMVGTVRVHVSRSFKALAKMGAITLTRDVIRIADLEALERLAGGAESDDAPVRGERHR
jgi:CRP/FNR family transcriptional regulator